MSKLTMDDRKKPSRRAWTAWVWTLGAFVAVFAGVIIASLLLKSRLPFGTVITVLGGAMGAVFAAGGLLIGIIAVITLLQLEDRIKAERERAYEELQPKLEAQAEAQINAHFKFFYAQNAQDWKSAEDLTKEALAHYPQLRGARATLGMQLAANAVRHFKLGYAVWDDIRLRVPTWGWQASEAPVTEAIQWLEEAIKHGEEGDYRVRANLALAYGLNGRPEKMLVSLDQLTDADKEYLLGPDQLMALARGCLDAPEVLGEVGQRLGISLPVSAQTLQRWLDEVDVTSMPQVVDVWALARPGWYWMRGAPRWPAQVRFRISGRDGARVAECTWFPAVSGNPVTVPENKDNGPMWASTAEIASEACQRFMVVAKCDPVVPNVSAGALGDF